jgi:hypothetical protein
MAMSDRITDLIKQAASGGRSADEIEALVWDALPETIRKQLGQTRLRQIIAIELNDPDQLEIAIDGERFAAADVPPDLLLKRAGQLRARAAGLIRRAEELEAAAALRRKA